MKKRLLSLALTLVMLLGLLSAVTATASAATFVSNIKLGDYVVLGGIKWRCVAFEKVSGYDGYNNPIIDSTQTSQTSGGGYLPLMLADVSIGKKEFDAKGTSGSHSRDSGKRSAYGSSYWGDSNIRDWLNSSATAGNVVWSCGNPPSYQNEAGFLTKFSADEKALMKTVTQKSLLAECDYNALKNSGNVSGSKVHTYNSDIATSVQNYSTAYSEQITDTMFLLDVQQAYNVYANGSTLGKYFYILSTNYWLRSTIGNSSYPVRSIWTSGESATQSAYYAAVGVRPAFFLDPASATYFKCGDGTSAQPYRVSHGPMQDKDENGHFSYCIYCNQELSRGAHTYSTDDRKHTCTECGYAVNHTYNENGVCTVCDHACGHSSQTTYTSTTEHYQVCAYCKRRIEAQAHNYINKGNKTYHYCQACNYNQSHSFGGWVVTREPDTDADGEKKRTCSICGYEDSVTFKKPPHSENGSHSLCNDSSCTEHAEVKWFGVYFKDNLVDVNNKLNQCIISAFTLSTVWEMPNTASPWPSSKRNKVDNCLDGERITLSDGAYIHIKSGQTYSLTDCREGMGKISGGTDGVIKIDQGGTFNFFEGTITGNSGEGIIVNNGTMNLYGGSIISNEGAAIINNGTLNIYGGTITGNTGGGIIGTGKIHFRTGHNGDNNIVIANNTVDGAPCNVKGTNTINVTGFGEGASIGFTPAAEVTKGNPVDISTNGGNYFSRFVSDSDKYEIIKNNTKIQIIAAHSVLTHHAAVPASCTETGTGEYWECTACKKLFADADGSKQITAAETLDATGHSLTHHEEKAPTCTEGGNREYWQCSACGNVFEDEEATREIDGIPTLDVADHSYSQDWTTSQTHHWHKCANCDAINEKTSHVYDGDQDPTCNTCGYVRSIGAASGALRGSGRSLGWVCSQEGTLTISDPLGQGEAVLAATYDEDGALVGLKKLTAARLSAEVDLSAARLRLFWLDGRAAPLSPAETAWEK